MACAGLLAAVLAACGLEMDGLGPSGDDAGLAPDVTQTGPDGATGGDDGGATVDASQDGHDATSSAEAAAEASEDAPPDVSTGKDAAGCQSDNDCTGSLFGGVCIAGTCGCYSEGDCPLSEYAACKGQVCTSSCAGGLACNQGCCDSTSTCVAGESTPAACGTDGNACQICGQDTPTCSGGNCTSDCGASGDGTCGAGFCCQQDSCAAIEDDACAQSGGTCVDCTTSSVTPVCLSNGTCGCNTSSDCDSPDLCGNDKCQAPLSCGIGNTCSNGNCCAGNTCSDSCASCQLGFCVCQKNNDCPKGTTCHCASGNPPCTGFGTCS